MEDSGSFNITRRGFLIASCGLLLPRVGWTDTGHKPLLAWPLDGNGSPTLEAMTGTEATLVDGTGRLGWVAVAGAELPRFDGYSVWLQHDLSPAVSIGREFSISAWVALESFPVATASIVEWGDATSGVSLEVDRLGFAAASIREQGKTAISRSEQTLPLRQWSHLAVTLSLSGWLTLFVAGREAVRTQIGKSDSAFAPIAKVLIGRAAAQVKIAEVFDTNVINGLVREVRIYNVQLTTNEIEMLSREFKAELAPLATSPFAFAKDPQRPTYHAMPPRAWTNEPHGLVHFQGQYHLFYQKNPSGPYWGHIHWGHMTSSDLLQWTEQPMALIPSAGPDADGCWSGSAIVAGGEIVLVYTAGDGKRSTICTASSKDGLHFHKHSANPVIDAPPSSIGVKEFRDPFVWKEGSEYRLIIGSGIADVGGTALLYRSTDLTTWIYLRPLMTGDKSTSGIFWEMPVFIKIGDFRVLIVCEVPGRASYWVGTWKNDEFHVLSMEPRRLDLLNHYLSPTPYIDEHGRVITIGIVPDSRNSEAAWQAGWAHLYGLPRELTLDAENHLQQQPFHGLATKFTPLLVSQSRQSLQQGWKVFETTSTSLSIKASLEQGSSSAILIALRRSPDRQEETILRYEWGRAQLTLDRTKSSLDTHTHRDVEQASCIPRLPGQITLEIFIDQSVLEVFIDHRACFASRMYPVLPESVGLAACAEGGPAYITDLFIGTLRDEEIPRLISEFQLL